MTVRPEPLPPPSLPVRRPLRPACVRQRCSGVPASILVAVLSHLPNLRALRLKGAPSAAILEMLTFLPHLEEFRFVMVGHDDDVGLFQAVTQFLRQRPRLRRLDLGSCPWDLVHGVLPDLSGLRVLRVRIANLTEV